MKTILIFVDWFVPAYKAGGPIRSIEGFIYNLEKHFNIYVITRDRDLNSKKPFTNIECNTWINYGTNTKIMYLSPRNFLSQIYTIYNICDSINIDYIYTNSFFSFHFSIIPYFLYDFNFLRSKSILIAPRGELKSERLKIKYFKKRSYLTITKLFLGFYKKADWHATSTNEKSNIVEIFNPKKIITIPNLRKNELYKNIEHRKKKGLLKIVFISRIISYKNLFYALEIINNSFYKSKIHFDIYGPIEDVVYFKKCVTFAEEMNLNVNYLGEIENKNVKTTFSKYDLFFFPTLGENYGHVIAEALLAGCPILISDRTPWSNLESRNIGWDISLENKDKFVDVLTQMVNLDNTEFQDMKTKIFKYIETNINSKDSIYKYIDYFSI